MTARRKPTTTTQPATAGKSPAQPAIAPRPPSFGAGLQWGLVLVPFVAALVAYHASYEVPLLFDDEYTLPTNKQLNEYSNPVIGGIAAAVGLPHSTLTNRPLSAISFAMNLKSHGLTVRGYHVINMLVHLGAVVALWDLVRLTLLIRRAKSADAANVERRSAAARWATAVALVWAVHPLQTEAVIYVTQRTTLLSSLFILLTLDFSVRAYVARSSRLARRWRWAAVAACVAGVLSKEIAVCAPLLVMLYDTTFVSNSWKETWRARRWFYGALASAWLVLLLIMAVAPANPTVGIAAARGQGYGWFDYVKTQAWAIGTYVKLSFWPTPLRLAYSLEPVREWSRVLLPGLLILAALTATVYGAIKRHWWGWLGACFFMILAPTSSVLPIVTELVTERVMYLPLAAVIVLVAMGVRGLVLSSSSWAPGVAAPARMATAVGVVLLAAGLLWATERRVQDYQTEYSIWLDTAQKSPDNYVAHTNLGRTLTERGDLDGAIREYSEAIRLHQAAGEAHSNLSTVYYAKAQRELTLQHNDVATEFMNLSVKHGQDAIKFTNRDRPEIHTNLSEPLGALGRFDEAARECEKAIQLAPFMAVGYNCLGIIHARQGHYAEAEQLFREALAREPNNLQPYYNLSTSEAQRGTRADGSIDPQSLAKAEVYLKQCLAINPRAAEAHQRLANIYRQQGRRQEAIQEYRTALQLNPHDLISQHMLQQLGG